MGNVRENEMLRTFNNGIGLVFITPQYNVEKLMNKLFCIGEHCNIIGEIRERK
jgi:phosphoribosylformylglycinamidine cyclo-ligase